MYGLQRLIRGNKVCVDEDGRVLVVICGKRRFVPFVWREKSQEYRRVLISAKHMSSLAVKGKVILVDECILIGVPLYEAEMFSWDGKPIKTDRIRFYGDYIPKE